MFFEIIFYVVQSCVGIILLPTCKKDYVKMRDNYVIMRLFCVNKQHIYAAMQHNCVNMRDIYVITRLKTCYTSTQLCCLMT